MAAFAKLAVPSALALEKFLALSITLGHGVVY